MIEPTDEETPPKVVNITAIGAAGARGYISEFTLEGVDLPFGLTHPQVRRFYRWLTAFYVRHNTLSIVVFAVGLLTTAVAVPLLVPGIVGLIVGAVVSLLWALVSPVAVVITRNIHHNP